MNEPSKTTCSHDALNANKNYSPCVFSSLYVKVDRFYFDLIHDSSRNQDLAAIKTIYGALLARVEHNLRQTIGLSLTQENVLEMSESKIFSFRQYFPFFEPYKSDEIRTYLSFIVELRGLNTHFAHWETPRLTRTIKRVLDTFRSEGVSEDRGHITFFGMVLVLSPIATFSMTHDTAFALVNKRNSFGPEGEKMRPYAGKLAPMLTNTAYPACKNDALPAAIANPAQYRFLCSEFFKSAGDFFLETEAELADVIKKKYFKKEDYMKHLNGNLIELMDEANYLPGEANRYLRNGICFLRNAVFHGNLFEEEVTCFNETKPLTLDFFCTIFKQWADALPDLAQHERHLSRVRRCLSVIPHNLFARLIEVSYKMCFQELFESSKVPERVSNVNKAFENTQQEVWPGFGASITKVMSFFSKDPCQMAISPGRFKKGNLPYTYQTKDKLIINSYFSSTGIWVGGVNAGAQNLILAQIPETNLPLVNITDKNGHLFHESKVTQEGMFEIHHQIVGDRQ